MAETFNINTKVITDGVDAWLKGAQERIPKALKGAIYDEVWRLKEVTSQGIRGDAPGGKPLARLSRFTQLFYSVSGVQYGAIPLFKFGKVVKYKVTKSEGKINSAEIGFINDILDRWAQKHAEGYEINLTPEQRKWMAKKISMFGIKTGGGGGGGQIKVPPRPIIPQVYAAEEDTIIKNIRDKVLAAAQVGGQV